MAVLNVTLNGYSVDYPLEVDGRLTDADVRRIALELVQSGGAPGLGGVDVPAGAFDGHVVDRMRGLDGTERLYLRPKVPFG